VLPERAVSLSDGSETLAFQIAKALGASVLAQTGTFPSGTIGVAPTAQLPVIAGTESPVPQDAPAESG
jgi:hypothetical protein